MRLMYGVIEEFGRLSGKTGSEMKTSETKSNNIL